MSTGDSINDIDIVKGRSINIAYASGNGTSAAMMMHTPQMRGSVNITISDCQATAVPTDAPNATATPTVSPPTTPSPDTIVPPTSTPTSVPVGNAASSDDSGFVSKFWWLWVIIGVVVLGLLIGLISYCAWKKKKEDEELPLNAFFDMVGESEGRKFEDFDNTTELANL